MKAIQISAAGRAVKARPVIKLSKTGRLALSLGLLRQKMRADACISEKSSYLCSAFHFERAAKLATNSAGIYFALPSTYTAPTPVRCVNAPAARSEWNATGQRSRFLCIHPIV